MCMRAGTGVSVCLCQLLGCTQGSHQACVCVYLGRGARGGVGWGGLLVAYCRGSDCWCVAVAGRTKQFMYRRALMKGLFRSLLTGAHIKAGLRMN